MRGEHVTQAIPLLFSGTATGILIAGFIGMNPCKRLNHNLTNSEKPGERSAGHVHTSDGVDHEI